LNKIDRILSFGDYSSILVAALPFVLVAVVEAANIPVATALMYAKHFWWRVLFFIGMVLLATITFETMLNGFERNFSILNITIDEKKNGSLLLQDKVDVLENRKEKLILLTYSKLITITESMFKPQTTLIKQH
jgi:ABC-type sugar transport system permease subunit